MSESVFSRIWRDGTWGGGCGGGSRSYIADLYARAMKPYTAGRRVVDVGCGNYSVGRLLICGNYCGVDIVPGMIEQNIRRYASEHVRFVCGNATVDDPIPGDVCLVRQVLQHLSFEDIWDVLQRLQSAGYEDIFITDAVRGQGINSDMASGARVRRLGLYLEAYPFECSVRHIITVENIRTVQVALSPTKIAGNKGD